ncbi:MAG: flagellin [Pseudomonadota bacterium]|jgi:flagellin
MSLTIRTNIAAMEAQKNVLRANSALQTSFNRLSSGYRINSAGDDAAGLAISENMMTQIRSYTIAERNANDAISMVQTAEGALGEIQGIMGRMRELAMQGANGSYTQSDRGLMDVEYQALKLEIQRIQGSARFNGKLLLDLNPETVTFQVGLNNTAADQLAVTFGGFGLSSLIDSANSLSGSTSSTSLVALTLVDATMNVLSSERAKYGAAMNRLTISTSSIQTMRLNLSAANSRIRDVDVALETAALAKNQVLSQTGVAILSQANQLPQMALNLIS